MALSKEDLAAFAEMMKAEREALKTELRTELSRDTHAAITRRMGDIKQVISPEKEQEVPQEELSLKEQLRQLRKERDAERLEMQNEKIQNHILSSLSSKKVLRPEIAAKLIREKFQYKDGRVVSLDEYGEIIPTDQVIDSFLKEVPELRAPVPVQGSGVKREYQGVSSPYGAGGNPDVDESAADGGSFRVKIPTLGDPTRERILGKSEQES